MGNVIVPDVVGRKEVATTNSRRVRQLSVTGSCTKAASYDAASDDSEHKGKGS